MSRDHRDVGIGWRSPRIAQVRAGARRVVAGPTRRQMLVWAASGIASGAAIAAATGLGLAAHPAGRDLLSRLFDRTANEGGRNSPNKQTSDLSSVDGAPSFELELPSLFATASGGSEGTAGSGDVANVPGQDVARALAFDGGPEGLTVGLTPGGASLEGGERTSASLDGARPPFASGAAQAEAAVADAAGAPNLSGSEQTVGGAAADTAPDGAPTLAAVAPTPLPESNPRAVDPFGSDSPLPRPSLGVPRIGPLVVATVPAGALLRIPALGIEAPLVPTGLDPEGRMLAPSGPRVIGWFDLGPSPGETGNAILSGHVDWYDGTPAIFGNLEDINPGDQVIYEPGESEPVQRFDVLWQRSYLAAQAPINEIVGQRPDANELTLITCSGQFIFEERNYTHRLVVRCGKV